MHASEHFFAYGLYAIGIKYEKIGVYNQAIKLSILFSFNKKSLLFIPFTSHAQRHAFLHVSPIDLSYIHSFLYYKDNGSYRIHFIQWNALCGFSSYFCSFPCVYTTMMLYEKLTVYFEHINTNTTVYVLYFPIHFVILSSFICNKYSLLSSFHFIEWK